MSEGNRLFDAGSVLGHSLRGGEGNSVALYKMHLQKRKEKNEANMRLTNFKKLYTRAKTGAGAHLQVHQEKLRLTDSKSESVPMLTWSGMK